MITVKERLDHNETSIDEFTIYDLYSQMQENKKPLGSSSTASAETGSVTTRSQYQMANYSINDLVEFVKCSMTKIQ